MQKELSNISSISKLMDTPEIPKKMTSETQVNTVKNKIAFFNACEHRDLEKLTQLIDCGFNVNMINDRAKSPSNVTALHCCAMLGWIEGLSVLLAAGACEKKMRLYSSEDKGKVQESTGAEMKHTSLSVAVKFDQPKAFSLLFPHYNESERIKAIGCPINSPVIYSDIFLEIDRLGYSQYLSRTQLVDLFESVMDGLDSSKTSFDAPDLRKVIDRCIELLNLHDKPKELTDIWLKALAYSENPRIIEGLAYRGLMVSEDGMLHVKWSEVLTTSEAPLCLLKMGTGVDKFTDEAQQTTPIGLATLAAIHASYHNPKSHETLYHLCALPALAHELLNNPTGRHFVVHEMFSNINLLKRFKNHGFDMKLLLNDEDQNPLHKAIKRRESKTTLESIAKVAIEWISQKDKFGKIPSDYIRDNSKKISLTTAFDKIALRDVLKHRRGSKATPEKQRRL